MALGGHLVSLETGLEIDFTRRALFVDGKVAPLGGRAFDILAELARSQGEVVSKHDLITAVWSGVSVDDAGLRVHISAIRKALGERRHVLNTDSGRGYRLLSAWEWRESDPHLGQDVDAGLPRTNLPRVAPSLVGREADVLQLELLLATERLATLTGAAGIGKTSLARELAHRAIARRQGDVWFVDLAPTQDGRVVASTIATALELELAGADPTPVAIARAIGRQQLFVVLDNCEHVIDAVAPAVEAINAACPRATIVATSREVLRIANEHTYRVPPLAVPKEEDRTLETIFGYSAAELFLARTRALDFHFAPRAEEALAIASICRRLEGIPLAIEIAAARAATSGCAEVVSHLTDRLAMVAPGRRTALLRHQTLKATLEWSYSLLTEVERMILRRLSIFAGWFDIGSAKSVVSGSGIETEDVDALLPALALKSLISFDSSQVTPSYRLLVLTRAFGLDLLEVEGEHDEVARRHAEKMCVEIEHLERDSMSLPQQQWVERYARRLDDVRSALHWALKKECDIDLGVTLIARTIPLWNQLSLLKECQEWIELAINKAGLGAGSGDAREMKLFSVLGNILIHSIGPAPAAIAACTRSLEIAERLDEIDYQLRALLALWNGCFANGEAREGEEIALRFRRIATMSSDPADVLLGHRLYGTSLLVLGDKIGARNYLEKAVNGYYLLPRSSNLARFGIDQLVSARALLTLTLLHLGLIDQAQHMAEQCLNEAVQSKNALTVCGIVTTTCTVTSLYAGDYESLRRYVAVVEEYAESFGILQWRDLASAFGAVAEIREGNVAEGLQGLRGLLDDTIDLGNMRYIPIFCEYALALGEAGNTERGRILMRDCRERAEKTGQIAYLPEFKRVDAALMIMDGAFDHALVEQLLREAADEARAQTSYLRELQIVTDLARLLHGQGRGSEAYDLLAPIYANFAEGHGARPLVEAKLVLERISGHQR